MESVAPVIPDLHISGYEVQVRPKNLPQQRLFCQHAYIVMLIASFHTVT